ncbi:hypothetical protein ASE92_11665 [Pedobacter sp. Leaf41]|nr:hypothetical protein ASE92_11665 [Pedobacter sp. Leaf41]
MLRLPRKYRFTRKFNLGFPLCGVSDSAANTLLKIFISYSAHNFVFFAAFVVNKIFALFAVKVLVNLFTKIKPFAYLESEIFNLNSEHELQAYL